MADGTAVAGSVAKEAGIGFEELASIIATTAETTRQEGSQIGNAMKTIMARISRSKSADPDVDAADRSTTAKAYKDVAGIDLYDDKGQYKDLSETLSELAGKWSTLTDAQRNYIAEESAGVRNINTFTVMMENYSKSIELASDALEDTDFAEGVQDKWMESMTAKLNTLKASLQDFWNTLLDTGVINTGIGLLSTLVDIGETIINVFKNVGSVFGEIGSGIGGMAGAATILYTLSQGYKSFKDGGSFFGGVANIGKDIIGLPSTFKSLFDTFKEGIMVGRELVREGTIIGNTFTTVSTAASSTTGIVSKLGAGFGALAGKLGISTLALGGWIGAIVAVGAVAIAAWNNIETSSEAAEKAGKKFDEYKKSVDSIQDNKKSADKVMPEFVELSAGVNPDTGANISLTNDEMERYTELSNQIADMFPTLISGYDSQGNAIIKLKDGVASLNEEYEKQLKIEEQKNIDENAKDYVKNFNNITGNRGWWTGLKDSFGDTLNYMFTGNAIEIGKTVDNERALEILKGVQGKSVSELQEAYKNLDMSPLEESMLEGLGLDSNIEDMTAEQWNTVHATITSKIAELENDLSTSETQMKSIMNSYFNTLTLSGGSYDNMSDELTKNISTFINGLDDNSLKEMLDKSKGNDAVTILKEYVTDISSKLDNNPDAQISLKNLLSISDNTAIEDLEEIIGKDLDILSQKLGKDKAELTIQLGLEGKEEIIKSYNDIKTKISDDLDKQGQENINKLQKQVENVGGALDFDNKKSASSDSLRKAGYDHDGKESSYMARVVDTETASLVVSPVLPNGEIMTSNDFSKYINEVIAKGEKDTKGITLATFDKKDVKNGKDYRKEADKLVKNLKEAEKQSGYFGDNQKLVSSFMEDNNIKTSEQVDLLEKCYEETGNWAEAMSRFSVENVDLALNEEMLQSLKSNLSVVKSNIEYVNQAIESTNTSIGMSSEEINNLTKVFGGLEGYNYDKLFESTAEGVKTNAQELQRLNKLYEEQESGKYQKEIENLESQYAYTCKELANLTRGTEEYQNKLAQRDSLVQQIKDAQELQSMYEGMTNSVTKYLQAKESTDPDKDYLTITKDIESIETMWKHGEVGRDDFQSFVQMFTNANLESIDDFVNAYDGAMKKAKRYFTENGSGAENFLEDMQKKDSSLASKDSKGFWTIDASIETISEKMNMTQAAVQEMFNRLKIFGFDVDFKEADDYLRGLRDDALEANKAFKGLGDLKIDLDVEDPKKLQEQVDLMEGMQNAIKNTYGSNSSEYNAFIKQLDYLQAKLENISKDEYVVDIHSSEGLEFLKKNLEAINKLKNTSIEIDFSNQSPEYVAGKIEEITEAAKDLERNSDGTIKLDQEGGKEVISVLSALIQQQQEIKNNSRVILTMDTSKLEGSALQAINSLKEVEKAYQTYSDLVAQKNAGIKVNDQEFERAKNELIETTKYFSENSPEASASIKLDKIELDKEGAEEQIASLMAGLDTSAIVKIEGVDDTVFKDYDPGKKTVTLEIDDKKVKSQMDQIDSWVGTKKTLAFGENGLTSIYSDYKSIKDKTINIKYNYSSSGSKEPSQLNGTAHLTGTAYAGGTTGDWGADKDETALVGELGSELVSI